MSSCMKKFKFIHQTLTLFKDSLWKILNVLSTFDIMFIVKSGSYFDHNFGLSFLDYKIGKNNLTNMKQTITSSLPRINLFSAIFSHLIGSILAYTTSKCFKKPINKTFICRSNFYNRLIMFVPIFSIPAVVSDEETTFSI